MDVKSRHKQTEIGVIPKDWDVRSIQEISNPVRGGSPRPAGDPRFFDGNFIPWLTVAALTNIPSSQLKVSQTDSGLTEEGSLRSRILYPGTLILANSGATLGIAKILGIKCCANDGIAALLNFDPAISTTYLVHFINTRTQYLRDVVATGNGQPNLNTDLIGNFKFPLPPTLAEQEAIAGALSDADAWIESLEQLIAKKRQIKQGAMQELLTGKRRLPGFRGEWTRKQIGDDIDLLTGFPFPSHSYTEHGIRLLRGSNIKRGVTDWSDDITQCWPCVTSDITQYQLQAGDIVVAMDGSLVGRSFARLSEADVPALLLQRVARIRSTSIDMAYLKEQICSGYFTEHCDAVKTVTAIPHISPKDIREFSIPIPPTKAEQHAIADILRDIDAEITALEAKLTKARQIKQGMMHELLTGRIRLIEPTREQQ